MKNNKIKLRLALVASVAAFILAVQAVSPAAVPVQAAVSSQEPTVSEEPEEEWEPPVSEEPEEEWEPPVSEEPEEEWEPPVSEEPEEEWEPPVSPAPEEEWEPPVSPTPSKAPRKSSRSSSSASSAAPEAKPARSAEAVSASAQITAIQNSLKTENSTALVNMGNMSGLSAKTMDQIFAATAAGKNVVIKFNYKGEEYTLLAAAGTKAPVDCKWYGPLKLMSMFPAIPK